MERVFKYLDSGKPCSISRNAQFDVLFEIVKPNTPQEQRFFRVIDRNSGEEKLKVRLNERAGGKPLNGFLNQYEPDRRPNLRENFPVDIDSHRVVFAEVNLSADPEIEVYLRIDIRNKSEDKKRYLSFRRKGEAILEGPTIPDVALDDDGGKKPLGGSID